MKIELIKKTTAIDGRFYFYVTVDGYSRTETWTTNQTEAEKSYLEVLEKAKTHPIDIYETLNSEEL